MGKRRIQVFGLSYSMYILAGKVKESSNDSNQTTKILVSHSFPTSALLALLVSSEELPRCWTWVPLEDSKEAE
jgi:hypothetical protein